VWELFVEYPNIEIAEREYKMIWTTEKTPAIAIQAYIRSTRLSKDLLSI
jgi:hypothetical protein